MLFLDHLFSWISGWSRSKLLGFLNINVLVLSWLELHGSTNKLGMLVVFLDFESEISFLRRELYQKWQFLSTQKLSLDLMRTQIEVKYIIFPIEFRVFIWIRVRLCSEISNYWSIWSNINCGSRNSSDRITNINLWSTWIYIHCCIQIDSRILCCWLYFWKNIHIVLFDHCLLINVRWKSIWQDWSNVAII